MVENVGSGELVLRKSDIRGKDKKSFLILSGDISDDVVLQKNESWGFELECIPWKKGVLMASFELKCNDEGAPLICELRAIGV